MKHHRAFVLSVIIALFLFTVPAAFSQGSITGLSNSELSALASAGIYNSGELPLVYDFTGSFSITGENLDIQSNMSGSCEINSSNAGQLSCNINGIEISVPVSTDQSADELLSQLAAVLRELIAGGSNQNAILSEGIATMLKMAGLSETALSQLASGQLVTLSLAGEDPLAHYTMNMNFADLLSSGLAPVILSGLFVDIGGEQIAALTAMVAGMIAEGTISLDEYVDLATNGVQRLILNINIPIFEINADTPPIIIQLRFELVLRSQPTPTPPEPPDIGEQPPVENEPLEPEPWEAVVVEPTGECPDYLIYHTNMTGNWEIFRLGDLPEFPDADPNLSRGAGPRVFNLMPTRSPDNNWIAFTSNRDGNWEIYVSSVIGDDIRRVTFNTSAVDQDPIWSPLGNAIIFESNRDGNWNLYSFDIATGAERQLTASPGNEVNAFWSYDGTRIVYQSDRGGFWQIYELNIANLEETLLSDGTADDHAPQYADDGQRVAFRSYRDGENSTLYIMNLDGSGVERISDPDGNALNHVWSTGSQLIGYQSDLNGNNDIYVYDTGSGATRQLTDNNTENYAPTWICNSQELAFTSTVTEDSNIFTASALPIDGAPIDVMAEASQLTTAPESDQYPMDTPADESASREESLPSPVKNR